MSALDTRPTTDEGQARAAIRELRRYAESYHETAARVSFKSVAEMLDATAHEFDAEAARLEREIAGSKPPP